MRPGELIPAKAPVPCNQGRTAVTLNVKNTSDRTVQVCSHYHFFEANKRLRFDRLAAYGRRLDIPAGTAVRWEPSEAREVRLTEFAGRRRIYGFHGLVNGALTEPAAAVERARELGFLDTGG